MQWLSSGHWLFDKVQLQDPLHWDLCRVQMLYCQMIVVGETQYWSSGNTFDNLFKCLLMLLVPLQRCPGWFFLPLLLGTLSLCERMQWPRNLCKNSWWRNGKIPRTQGRTGPPQQTCGMGYSSTERIFSWSVETPFSETTCPIYFMHFWKNRHFDCFNLRPASLRPVNTASNLDDRFSSEEME